jgi:hypothetical protein
LENSEKKSPCHENENVSNELLRGETEVKQKKSCGPV